MKRIISHLLAFVILCGVFSPTLVLGCATCFGQSDSALARGMNMGIFSLLGVIGAVLSCIVAFFIFLARQSARAAANGGAAEMGKTTTGPQT